MQVASLKYSHFFNHCHMKNLIPKGAKSIFVTSRKKRICLPDFVQVSMEK